MAKYKVQFKKTDEVLTLDEKGLKEFIETWFLKITPSIHKYLFNKITSSRVPFENHIFFITPSDVIFNPKTFNLPGEAHAPNHDLSIADRKKINYWTVFNTKNGKYTRFTNLAAAARAFDTSYSFLYTRIKGSTCHKFGHLVFTLDTVMERLDSAEKLREIL